MGILAMFFKKRNVFSTFEQKAKRLFAFETRMEKELVADHFRQFKGHLRAIMRIIGLPLKQNPRSLIRLLEAQKAITAIESDESKQAELKQFEANIENELHGIFRALEQAVIHCDAAIANINNPSTVAGEKQQLVRIVQYLERFTLKMRDDADKQRHLYEEVKNGEVNVALPPPVALEGRIGDWSLTTIQSVVRELGAYVKLGGGKHPYKIIKLGAHRPHTLAPGLDPNGFVDTLSAMLGVSKKRLRESFVRGKLIQ